MQTTLARPVHYEGIGLHGGVPVRMAILPARPEHGIVFERSDRTGSRIPARWDNVEQTALMTRLVGADGTSVATVEHVMAALAGCGVQNALVRLDGPEAPIADGSSAPFVRAILDAGIVEQAAPQQAICIRRMVEVRAGNAVARLTPSDRLVMDFAIEFPDAAIGSQRKVLDMGNGAFVRELCDARTFCRAADIAAMHDQGLALGGTYDNAVVVDGARVLTPGGLRYADEAVRHKMLDALGDLAQAGLPILGRYTGIRAGHAITNALLRDLFADPANYELVPVSARVADSLPGAHLQREDLRAVA